MDNEKKITEEKAYYAGHRQRMKNRYAQTQLTGFSDYEAIELLLFYSIPRKDTKKLAHELVDHFGSLAGVLEADIRELMDVEGVSEHTAGLISLIAQLNKRYFEEKNSDVRGFESSNDIGNYLISKYAYEVNECSYAMLLDTKYRLLHCCLIGSGVVNATEVGVRKLCEYALKYRASYVVVSHNHPSGKLMPSCEDESTTDYIRKSLDVLGVKLLDHIIVAGDRFISFKSMGLI